MLNNQTIHEFRKNVKEKIKVGFNSFKGSDLLSIWVYFDNSVTGVEDWRPSKKGISMRTDLMPELKKGIDKAYKEYEKQEKELSAGQEKG